MIKRYSRKELTDIWSEENKYKIWLDVEIAAAQAMEKFKLIPKGVVKKVKSRARINVNRILKIEEKGFSVVRDFCGHGIGTTFHESPNILHYGTKNTGMELKPGMTFTIEPMINAGKFATKMLNDGWTAVTKDKSLSAQFEHTVGITENGYEIFTESAKGYSKPPYL